jgi:hypothetical protein
MRLMSELPPVLRQILQHRREQDVKSLEFRVVPLRPGTRLEISGVFSLIAVPTH